MEVVELKITAQTPVRRISLTEIEATTLGEDDSAVGVGDLGRSVRSVPEARLR